LWFSFGKEKKKLTPKEIRAAKAVDILTITFLDKRILFGAYIHFQQGIIFRNRDGNGFFS